MHTILVLNGPNLNLLGQREPEIYGSASLADIEQHLQKVAAACDLRVECLQSNAEHLLVERIHAAGQEGVSGIIINAGGLAHGSIALRDALLGVGIAFIELHLSNPYARESFRHHSYLADKAVGVIYGLGAHGYELALLAHRHRLG